MGVDEVEHRRLFVGGGKDNTPTDHSADEAGEAAEAARLRRELSDARAEIERLRGELAAVQRRTDVRQAVGDFTRIIYELLDWRSIQDSAHYLRQKLDKPLPSPQKRQAFAVWLAFATLPGSLLLTGLLIWAALRVDTTGLLTLLLAIYAGHIALDRSPEMGGHPKGWMKGHWLWRNMARYFPVELHKMNPETSFPPEAVYLFGYHPHGVISVGCFVNFATSVTGFKDLFPGLNLRVATLSFNLRLPFFREWLLRMGVIAVSARSIRHVLGSGPGSAVIIVPGGAAESLDARPGTNDLTLQRRNGFFRIALQHGAHLVPTYSFGENELYEQVPNRPGSALRWFQESMLRLFGYTMPYFFGAGSQPWPGSGLPLNPVPNRHPVITVVGDPIPCERIENPTQEQIDALKEMYIAHLKEIFDRFADQYAPERERDLRIVK